MSNDLCRFCGLNPVRDGQMTCLACAELEDNFAWMYTNVGVTAPRTAKRKFFKRADTQQLTPMQEWFIEASKMADRKELLQRFTSAEPLGIFNVEGGSVDVSTRRRGLCDGCFDAFVIHRECEVCGSSPDNTVRVTSGLGDGEYGVWQTSGGKALLVGFDRPEGTPPSLEYTLRSLKNAAPLPLGDITSDGMFVIADPGHFPVYAGCTPGSHNAIAWIAPMAFELDTTGRVLLRPIALTLVEADASVQLMYDADQTLASHDLSRFQVAAAIWGSPAMPTSSHVEPVAEWLMMLKNRAVCESTEEWARDDAWAMAMVLAGDEHPEFAECMPDWDTWVEWLADRDPEMPYVHARCLLSIGREHDALQRLRMSAELGFPTAQLLLTRWESIVASGESLYPAWANLDLERAILELEGQRRTGQWEADSTLNTAASGYGPAIGNVTWTAVFDGEFDFGLLVHEVLSQNANEVTELMASRLPVEAHELAAHWRDARFNNESNAALLHVARGDDPHQSLATWQWLAELGRAESAAYAALLKQRLGDAHAMAACVAHLDDEERQTLWETLDDALTRAKQDTWAWAWFRELRDALRR